MNHFRIDPEVAEVFKMGLFYLCGRDKQNRPVYVIKPNRIKLAKLKSAVFIKSFITYSQMVRQHCFKEYHVENWIMLMDLEKKSVFDFSFKSLSLVLKSTNLFFGGCVHKIFMLNPSSFFSFSFKIVEKMLDKSTRQKINMLKPKEYPKMWQYIDAAQIPEEFGGQKLDVGVYWPPVMMKKDNEIPHIDVSKNVFFDESSSFPRISDGKLGQIQESKSGQRLGFQKQTIKNSVVTEGVDSKAPEILERDQVGKGQSPNMVTNFDVFLEENNSNRGPRFIPQVPKFRPSAKHTQQNRVSDCQSTQSLNTVLSSVLIEGQSKKSFTKSYSKSLGSRSTLYKTGAKTGSTGNFDVPSDLSDNRTISLVPFWKQ